MATNSIQDLIDAINDLINSGVDVRFIKDAIANDIELSQDPCGGWRFHVKEASVTNYLASSVSGVVIGATEDLYITTWAGVKSYIHGFNVWGDRDGVYDFLINGVRVGRTQTGTTRASDNFTFPKPVLIQFGDIIKLEVTNCSDPSGGLGKYLTTIYEEFIE